MSDASRPGEAASPRRALAAVLALAVARDRARAWEPQTTHAGLAEQAALSSRLHKRLVTLGFDGGLFEPLTIPPADAPTLIAALKLLSPTHGAVPDARGRQVGARVAHRRRGARRRPGGARRESLLRSADAAAAGRRPDRGVIAAARRTRSARRSAARRCPSAACPRPTGSPRRTTRSTSTRSATQYAKAVTAATPGERSRHMAAALVAAGAMLHVLGDLGAPSRVRGDEAAHFEPLGGGPDDLGSRFERIAALAFGRLGVPAPVARDHARRTCATTSRRRTAAASPT